jgi:hypothetical protein
MAEMTAVIGGDPAHVHPDAALVRNEWKERVSSGIKEVHVGPIVGSGGDPDVI